MSRLAAGVFIVLGVVLLIAASTGGFDTAPFVVGLASVVVGVVLRMSTGRPAAPHGNTEVFATGHSAPSAHHGPVPVGGVPAPMAGPSQFLGRRVDATFSAEDIVANGIAVAGRLRSAAMTGRTAGQVAPHLPPEQAADPIVQVEFEYSVDPRVNLVKEAYVRVPAGVVHRLAPGVEIPVRVIAEQPEIAAIDWSRF